jgi:hypothetical protein
LRNQGDEVDIYVTWRDCTLEVEHFTTSGSSNRDIFFKLFTLLSRVTDNQTLRGTEEGDFRVIEKMEKYFWRHYHLLYQITIHMILLLMIISL